MTPLPPAAPGSVLTAWRLERAAYQKTWARGDGAFKVGGRWSAPGRRVIYTSLDPATTILEVAVHKGFNALDIVPHALLRIDVVQACAFVVSAKSIPNAHWLLPGAVSVNQQRFGSDLLDKHAALLVPSAVSRHSWNLVIDVVAARGMFKLVRKEVFALDTRLTAGARP